MPNCEKLAKWFKEKMKVTEVIYFKVDIIKKTELDKETNQMFNDQVEEFMQRFMIEFYSLGIKKDE